MRSHWPCLLKSMIWRGLIEVSAGIFFCFCFLEKSLKLNFVSDLICISDEVLRLEEKLRELKLANQRLARNSRGHFEEPLVKTFEQLPLSVPAFVVDEKDLEDARNGVNTQSTIGAVIFSIIVTVLCKVL